MSFARIIELTICLPIDTISERVMPANRRNGEVAKTGSEAEFNSRDTKASVLGVDLNPSMENGTPPSWKSEEE